MWTDTYCITDQCGSSTGATPVGSALFPPSHDAEFGASVGGMIWPRAFVAAGAFWQFNASLDPTSAAFVATINALTASVAARGGYVCPVGCQCDQLSACGVPYIKPGPGASAFATSCVQPFPAGATWSMKPNGQIALMTNASLCLNEPAGGGYPLTLQPCGPSSTAWTHAPASSELISSSTGLCMDLNVASKAVGTYQCGSGSGDKQPNQEWAVDGVSGLILSLDGGLCLEVA